MGVTTTVVFSKDRPLQLCACLRSLQKLPCDVRVIFRTSQHNFREAYAILERTFTRYTFVEETDERDMGGLVRDSLGSEFVMFTVDDALWFGAFDLDAACNLLSRNDTVYGVHAKLCPRVEFAHPCTKFMRLPVLTKVSTSFFTFPLDSSEFDWNYAWDLSGTVYRSRDVRHMLDQIEKRFGVDGINHPNLLEGYGVRLIKQQEIDIPPRMACVEHPVMAILTINKVQTLFDNPVYHSMDTSVDELLTQFDRLVNENRLNSDIFPLTHYRETYFDSVHVNIVPPPSQHPGLVSWLMPVYNTPAAWLREAVASCVRQRAVSALTKDIYFSAASTVHKEGNSAFDVMTAWEIVCVDDGSTTTDTLEVLTELAAEIGPRLRIVRTENQGVAGALNVGWSHCRGEFVARLDSDDIAHECRLSTQLSYLAQHPSVGILGGAFHTFTDASVRHQGPYYRFPCHPALVKWNMVFACSLAHPTVIWRKSTHESGSLYPMEEAEDHWCWLQMAARGVQMANVGDVCTYIRRHPGARTKVHIDKITQSSYEAVRYFLQHTVGVTVNVEDVAIMWGKELPQCAEQCAPLSTVLDALVEYSCRNIGEDEFSADGRRAALEEYMRAWTQKLRGSWSVSCLAAGDVATGATMIQNLLRHNGDCPKSLGALLRLGEGTDARSN